MTNSWCCENFTLMCLISLRWIFVFKICFIRNSFGWILNYSMSLVVRIQKVEDLNMFEFLWRETWWAEGLINCFEAEWMNEWKNRMKISRKKEQQRVIILLNFLLMSTCENKFYFDVIDLEMFFVLFSLILFACFMIWSSYYFCVKFCFRE